MAGFLAEGHIGVQYCKLCVSSNISSVALAEEVDTGLSTQRGDGKYKSWTEKISGVTGMSELVLEGFAVENIRGWARTS